MESPIRVCFNLGFDEKENLIFFLKISAPDWELNIEMTEEETALIPSARTARWDDSGSVRIGNALGASTFWSCNDGRLDILIGQDDECWEIAISMPEPVIDGILAELERIKLEIPDFLQSRKR